MLLLATGSEVQLGAGGWRTLAAEGIKAQVVSMPCWSCLRLGRGIQESVIPSAVKARVGVEAGVRLGWDRWLGSCGEFVGMHTFGASGPFKVCFEKFGITAEAVVAAAKKSMNT